MKEVLKEFLTPFKRLLIELIPLIFYITIFYLLNNYFKEDMEEYGNLYVCSRYDFKTIYTQATWNTLILVGSAFVFSLFIILLFRCFDKVGLRFISPELSEIFFQGISSFPIFFIGLFVVFYCKVVESTIAGSLALAIGDFIIGSVYSTLNYKLELEFSPTRLAAIDARGHCISNLIIRRHPLILFRNYGVTFLKSIFDTFEAKLPLLLSGSIIAEQAFLLPKGLGYFAIQSTGLRNPSDRNVEVLIFVAGLFLAIITLVRSIRCFFIPLTILIGSKILKKIRNRVSRGETI